MNILFLGAHPTSTLIAKSKGKVDSLYRSDEAIINGLRKRRDINLKVVTSPEIPHYPRNSFYYGKFWDSIDNQLSISILNLPILSVIWTTIGLLIESTRLIRKFQGEVTIILPFLVFKHVFVAAILKRIFSKRVKVLVIVPDIFFYNTWKEKQLNNIAETMAHDFDYFVLYTSAMSEYLKLKSQQYIVIEGFFTPIKKHCKQPQDKFIITYTGSLNIKYGLIRLLDMMQYIRYDNVELHIYGTGDCDSIIAERSKYDKRIIFKGLVPKDQALDAIYNSSVLVNPRNNDDGEYVKYSFPSKNLEYLNSGVPTVLCRLKGMPESYNGFYIDAGNGSPEELANALIRVYNMTYQERDSFGMNAKAFIEERMNIDNQIKQIVNLMTSNR